MISLEDFLLKAERFGDMSPREQIITLAWYLHTIQSIEVFDNATIRGCYRSLHISAPDVSVYLPRMAASKPPVLLKQRGSYKLERSIRVNLDKKYKDNASYVETHKILTELGTSLTDADERVFFAEALSCYRIKAFRACTVMVWNLSYDHILNWLISDAERLSIFNHAIARRYPKKSNIQIAKREQFEEFKEAEIIEVCLTAALISKNVIEILREKLKRRNSAAHPSKIKISQSQADDTISDLINNVVLHLRN